MMSYNRLRMLACTLYRILYRVTLKVGVHRIVSALLCLAAILFLLISVLHGKADKNGVHFTKLEDVWQRDVIHGRKSPVRLDELSFPDPNDLRHRVVRNNLRTFWRSYTRSEIRARNHDIDFVYTFANGSILNHVYRRLVLKSCDGVMFSSESDYYSLQTGISHISKLIGPVVEAGSTADESFITSNRQRIAQSLFSSVASSTTTTATATAGGEGVSEKLKVKALESLLRAIETSLKPAAAALAEERLAENTDHKDRRKPSFFSVVSTTTTTTPPMVRPSSDENADAGEGADAVHATPTRVVNAANHDRLGEYVLVTVPIFYSALPDASARTHTRNVTLPIPRSLAKAILSASDEYRARFSSSAARAAAAADRPMGEKQDGASSKRRAKQFNMTMESVGVFLAELFRVSSTTPRCSIRRRLGYPRTNAKLLHAVRAVRSQTVDNRDRESDELRYSIRSFEQHTRWHTGRLLLVSPGHSPSWIDESKNFLASVCIDDATELLPVGRRSLGLPVMPMEEVTAMSLPEGVDMKSLNKIVRRKKTANDEMVRRAAARGLKLLLNYDVKEAEKKILLLNLANGEADAADGEDSGGSKANRNGGDAASYETPERRLDSRFIPTTEEDFGDGRRVLCFTSNAHRMRNVYAGNEPYRYKTSVQRFADSSSASTNATTSTTTASAKDGEAATMARPSIEDGEGILPDPNTLKGQFWRNHDESSVVDDTVRVLDLDGHAHHRHRRLIAVHQDCLLPHGMRVTINSFTIEQYLYRIRNATAVHLYINDDYFLNRNLRVSHLFNQYGGVVVRGDNFITDAVRADEGSVDWREGVYHSNLFSIKSAEMDREDYLSPGLEEMWRAEHRVETPVFVTSSTTPGTTAASAAATAVRVNSIINNAERTVSTASVVRGGIASNVASEGYLTVTASTTDEIATAESIVASLAPAVSALPRAFNLSGFLIAPSSLLAKTGIASTRPYLNSRNVLPIGVLPRLLGPTRGGALRIAHNAQEDPHRYSGEPLPPRAIPKHRRRYAMHAPFLYCNRLFEYINIRFERELSSNALWHRRRAAKDIHPPYLYADLALHRPWVSSPKFLPYLFELHRYRQQVEEYLADSNNATSSASHLQNGDIAIDTASTKTTATFPERRSTTNWSNNSGSKGEGVWSHHALSGGPPQRPPMTAILLDNEDACAPATFVSGQASLSKFAKFVDDFDKNFNRIRGIERANPLFFNINTDFSWDNVSVLMQTYIAAKFPFPSYLETGNSTSFRLAKSPFLYDIRSHRRRRPYSPANAPVFSPEEWGGDTKHEGQGGGGGGDAEPQRMAFAAGDDGRVNEPMRNTSNIYGEGGGEGGGDPFTAATRTAPTTAISSSSTRQNNHNGKGHFAVPSPMVSQPPLNTSIILLGSDPFQELFADLMALPLVLIANDEEAFCPLVRSLQFALPRYAGREIVLVHVPPAHGKSVALMRAEQRHPVRHFMPVTLCTYSIKRVRVTTVPAGTPTVHAARAGLREIMNRRPPNDKVLPTAVLHRVRTTQAEEKLSDPLHKATEGDKLATNTRLVRGIVIDATTAAAGDVNAWGSYESLLEALGIPGQSLALEDFKQVSFPAHALLPEATRSSSVAGMNTHDGRGEKGQAGQAADGETSGENEEEDEDENSEEGVDAKGRERRNVLLVLKASEAARRAVHWITGGSENDLLSAYPLPSSKWENMNAPVRFSYEVEDEEETPISEVLSV